MPAVRAIGLTKRFGSTAAVAGVDLTIGAGEVKGLLGLNGAGKTTLLRMLLGLVAPDEGSIELLGRAREASQPLDGVAGFVEEPSFYPYLSGRDNLAVLAELDGDGAAARIDTALQRVGLAGRGADRVGGYSSGMRQRLGLAAALMREPRLVVLDEPTAGLDPAGVRFVGELVRELSGAGAAVLVSSHQIGEVEDACDSFSVLSRGRLVWDGTAAQMRAAAPPSAYALATSDDEHALRLAASAAGLHAQPEPSGGLRVKAQAAAMDELVVDLGRAGVAVRRLDLVTSPLESMFFVLTEQETGAPGARQA